MKKWLWVVPFVYASVIFGYLTDKEVIKLKMDYLLPVKETHQLNQFFRLNPKVKKIFTQTAGTLNGPIWGPGPDADQATLDIVFKQGWEQDPENPHFLRYRTTPNHNFPDTFDPQKHAWKDRPMTRTRNLDEAGFEKVMGVQAFKEERQKRLETIDYVNKTLADVGLKNLANPRKEPIYGNLVIQVGDLILATALRAWTTYPQVFSRLVNKIQYQRLMCEKGYTHLGCPEMYLYHIEGQPDDFTEQNWIIVSRFVKDVISDAELVEVFAQEPPHAAVKELIEFCEPDTPVWKELIAFEDTPDGPRVIDKRVLFTKTANGDYTAEIINTEMPSVGGAYADEDRCVRLTMDPAKPTLYNFTAARDNLEKFRKAAKEEVERKAAAEKEAELKEQKPQKHIAGKKAESSSSDE